MNFSDEVALKDVSEYSKEKIDIGEISISNYVSTFEPLIEEKKPITLPENCLHSIFPSTTEKK